MKARVTQDFFDRTANKLRKVNDEIEVDEARFKKLKNLKLVEDKKEQAPQGKLNQETKDN